MPRKINRNPALSTSFKLEIPGFEEVNYMVQTAELPGLMMGGVDAPYQKFATSVPSNRVEFDPLNLTFIVDEDFKNYESIFAWMVNITRSEPVVKTQLKNMTLHLTNSNKNTIIGVRFHQAYPTMVSAIPFESSSTDPMPMVCNVSFRYQYFEFIRKTEPVL